MTPAFHLFKLVIIDFDGYLVCKFGDLFNEDAREIPKNSTSDMVILN